MEIKEHRLLLFIEIYKELFGESLSRADALEKATLLLQFGLMCIKPLAKPQGDDIMDIPNDND